MEKPPQTLKEWLVDRCRQDRLSLRQAAAKSGLSHATLADIANGTSPCATTVRKLARAFGGNGLHERMSLEDHLLVLAGYRTPREEEAPNLPMARLIDKLNQFGESQLKVMLSFAEFLAEKEEK